MEFVYEEISAEKGEELFNKYHFMQMKDTPVKPTTWVIDRERSIFMVGERVGKGTNSLDDIVETARSLMIWNEEPIEIEFYDYIPPQNTEKYDVNIYIKAIRVTTEFAQKHDENNVKDVVKEAILRDYTRNDDWIGNKNASFNIVEVPSSWALYHAGDRE